MQMDGGQALIRALELEGVDVMFGLPGGAILPVYDPIIDSSIRHILVRHEQGAGHMAEGFAHATGRPGVAMVTSGPGATNIVTPLCDAHMDSVPLVVITGQVPYAAIGTDAFQECDTTGITQSVTKHNFLVSDAQDIPRIIKEAFHIATTGRPGPVLVDIPKDIVDPRNPRSAMEWTDDVEMDLPGYNPRTDVDPAAIRAAAEMIRAAERPVLYVGGGILKARAAEALRRLGAFGRIGRRHALSALDGLGALDVTTWQRALSDADPEIRKLGLRVGERLFENSDSSSSTTTMSTEEVTFWVDWPPKMTAKIEKSTRLNSSHAQSRMPSSA